MSEAEITLKVGKVNYGGWKRIQVDLSMSQIAGTFGFVATDIFPGQTEKWRIRMGEECEVLVNDYPVLKGWVDGVQISYSNDVHEFQVVGRDKTGDLVDCGWENILKTEWVGVSVLSIMFDLCDPFGIDVTYDSSVAAKVLEKPEPDKFKINEGDSIFQTISRLCSMKGILPITYGDGKLHLARAGTTYVDDQIQLGVNVLSGYFSLSDADRFSIYVVKGQGVGKDVWDLTSISHPVGRQTDEVIERHRPLLVLADTATTSGQCQERANWEAHIRAGKSRTLQYELQGWTQSSGNPWPINHLVRVKDDFLGVNDSHLIESVAYYFDEQGRRTRLGLVHPDAYKALAIPVKKTGKTGFDFDIPAALEVLKK